MSKLVALGFLTTVLFCLLVVFDPFETEFTVVDLKYYFRASTVSETLSGAENSVVNHGDREHDMGGRPLTCALPYSSDFSRFLSPIRRPGAISYVLPSSPRNEPALSNDELEKSCIFTFIHVNKAGGTLVKEEIFKQAALENGWSGAGLGVLSGWPVLLEKCGAGRLKSSEDAFNCGSVQDLDSCFTKTTKCPIRLLFGTHSMGLCSLYSKTPCVMAIVLRHPVERLVSQYNYVCVEGREGQKKWKEKWKAMNYCPLSLLEFLQSDLTSKTFLIDHLTRAGDEQCGVDLAIQNLQHPCMRFLLLDRYADGLRRLSETWGPTMRPIIERVAAKEASLTGVNQRKNHTPYPARTRSQIENPQIMKEVRNILRLDIEFYERAVTLYDKQWENSLVSCNSML